MHLLPTGVVALVGLIALAAARLDYLVKYKASPIKCRQCVESGSVPCRLGRTSPRCPHSHDGTTSELVALPGLAPRATPVRVAVRAER